MDAETENIFVSSFIIIHSVRKVAAIFVYVVVPNNGDMIEVVLRYTFEVVLRNWPRSSDRFIMCKVGLH